MVNSAVARFSALICQQISIRLIHSIIHVEQCTAEILHGMMFAVSESTSLCTDTTVVT